LFLLKTELRWYWTNIPGVDQPEQRGIVLRDILEYQLEDNTNAIPNKSQTIKSQYYKSSKANFERSGTFHATGIPQKSKERYIETHDTPKQIAIATDVNGHDILKRVYSEDGKSPVVTTCGGGNTEPKVVAGAWRGRSLDESGKNVAWKETKPKQMLELRKDEKSNSLTSVGKDNLVVQSYREVRTEEAKRLRRESKKNTGKDHTPFRAKKIVPREDGKVGTVTPGLNNDHMISLTRDKDQDVYWRKLTLLRVREIANSTRRLH
jgi:hypothetical protein